MLKTGKIITALWYALVMPLATMAQDVYVNVETKGVNRFINEVHYTPESSSRVAEYKSMTTTPDNWPQPATISVRHTDGDSLTLLLSTDRTFTDPVVTGISGSQDKVSVYNLIPRSTYYYKIMSLADTVVTQGHIYTQGQVRHIKASPGGFNIRDLGGWPVADGRIIGYGRLFRGSELNGVHVADSAAIADLRQLGIGAEIDMRYTGENSGAGISAFHFTTEADDQGDYLYTNNLSIQTYSFTYDSFTSRLRRIVRFINRQLQQGKAVYMHCVWGADRTGLVAMLLEGLLGADYDVLMKDYELSCFVGFGRTKADREDVINYIMQQEGTTMQQKFNSYFVNTVKLPQDEIDLFTELMLDEAPAAGSCSGTLPVVYVSCDDSIKSKELYLPATVFIDNMGDSRFQSVGSADSLVNVQIRGRGNWTWTGGFTKKPYKLKFDKGLPLLGMGSNKHWALLAHADGGVKSYFRNTAGFELGRMAGLPFTPHQQPVELVLNGEYQGLYFLTETVRVGKRRVNISEQADFETDPDLVNGAWLVEIDNNDEDSLHQIRPLLDGTELTRFVITWHSPEELSPEQLEYISHEWDEVLRTVYCADKSSTEWEQHFDLDALARYYLVNEMIDHVEAFLGSCFMYKDKGEQQWKMGPMWDLGHAFNDWHPKDNFIWQYKHETEEDWEPCILEEMVKFPALMQSVQEIWMKESAAMYEAIDDYLQEFTFYIADATVSDRQRWPMYGTPDVQASLSAVMERLEQKRQFLTAEWGDPMVIDAISTLSAADKQPATLYNLQGQAVKQPGRKGLYIRQGRKIVK